MIQCYARVANLRWPPTPFLKLENAFGMPWRKATSSGLRRERRGRREDAYSRIVMLCVTKSSGCNHVCQICLLIDGVTHAVAQNFQRPCSCDEIEKARILRPVLCAPLSKWTGTGPGLISRDFQNARYCCHSHTRQRMPRPSYWVMQACH